jgi:hypothetical protein
MGENIMISDEEKQKIKADIVEKLNYLDFVEVEDS